MSTDTTPSQPTSQGKLGRRLASGIGAFLLIYLAAAYFLAPVFWRLYVHKHEALEDIPGITYTHLGIPGDPINVAIVGTRDELMRIMHSANWVRAAALGLHSDLEIAADSVLERSDPDAPASNLYLFDRKQDLVFEQQDGDSPRRRHHVRFWEGPRPSDDGRPLWVGSATFDERVGLSRRTGQITHVTAPDVDKERDYLMQCLGKTGQLARQFAQENFHAVREGKNGGGDPWFTDGALAVGIISIDET